MTETLSVPLNKLIAWDGNVRKTGVSEGIEELAASIAAHGLLQAPIVRKVKGGKFAVVAGQRRLLALKRLAEKGSIAADIDVTCQLVAMDADAGEISLAENVVRVAMHPADQFEAFRDLVDRGVDVAAVAARFGVAESVVVKRLKLGRLSPVVLDAYRRGEIDLEEAQAFAISDDHQAQERVLAEVSEWNRSPSLIRRHLTEGEVPASDKRVRFVSLDAYEQAGGVVRRDLFDDQDSGTLTDTLLLDRLVAEKLAVVAEAVKSEGWAWVEIAADFDRSMLADFRRLHPERIPLTDDRQEHFDYLSQEYDTLADSPEADEGDATVIARLTEIEDALEQFEQSQMVWNAETLAIAGAIVTLASNGTPSIERGLVRRGDEPETKTDEEIRHEPLGPSAALIEELTARKTAALQVAAAANVNVMVAAVVHTLALQAFYISSREHSCLLFSMKSSEPERAITVPDAFAPVQQIADAHQAWAERLPDDAKDLWDWCLKQPHDLLLALLAHIGARSIDAISRRAFGTGHGRFLNADALARAIGFDMADYYTPDAPTYFSRVSSAQIIWSLCEAKGVPAAPAWGRMKKAELAALAAREVAGTRWLPEVLRPHAASEIDDAA